MGSVQQPIQEGVGDGRIADGVVPFLHRDLTGDDGRSDPVTILDHLEQVAALAVSDRRDDQRQLLLPVGDNYFCRLSQPGLDVVFVS